MTLVVPSSGVAKSATLPVSGTKVSVVVAELVPAPFLVVIGSVV